MTVNILNLMLSSHDRISISCLPYDVQGKYLCCSCSKKALSTLLSRYICIYCSIRLIHKHLQFPLSFVTTTVFTVLGLTPRLKTSMLLPLPVAQTRRRDGERGTRAFEVGVSTSEMTAALQSSS